MHPKTARIKSINQLQRRLMKRSIDLPVPIHWDARIFLHVKRPSAPRAYGSHTRVISSYVDLTSGSIEVRVP